MIKNKLITSTVACVDYLNMGKEIESMDKGNIDYYHIDIMDGNYVPNLCLNFDIVRAINKVSNTPFDVHFMVKNPLSYIELLQNLNIEYACTHLDTDDDINVFLKRVREIGIKPGIVLSPQDSAKSIEEYLELIDFVLVMAVKPGFSGQTFIPETYNKIKEINSIRKENNKELLIAVDGGVTWDNAELCVLNGADMLIGGAFTVYDRTDTLENNVNKLRSIINQI